MVHTECILPETTAVLETELQAARPNVDAARLYCFRLTATAETEALLRAEQRSKDGTRPLSICLAARVVMRPVRDYSGDEGAQDA